MRLFTAHPVHAYLAARQQVARSTVAPNSRYPPPPPAFPAPKRRRLVLAPSDAIPSGMRNYHSNNEIEGSRSDEMSAGYDGRGDIQDAHLSNGYDSRAVGGNGEVGGSGSQSRAPYDLRSSGQANAPGPGPGYQPGLEQLGNQFSPPFPRPAGRNGFGDNGLQQPFVPPSPFPGDPFGMFNPTWNNFFGVNAGANSLPFVPPIFFPTPVLNAPAMNGLPPFPFDPSAFGGLNGPMQPGMHDPTANPESSRSRSKSPVAPEPARGYLTQASQPPKQLPTPQPLLVILDLNGTLIFRKSRKYPPSFTKRAGLDEFLDTLLKKYKVMVWSSSQPHTVRGVCEKLFRPEQRKKLVVEWGRDMFGLSRSQYSAKIQVYKKLETVWGNEVVQASYPGPAAKPHGGKFAAKKKRQAQSQTQRWDQTNTILIDDSKLKALSEPYNIIEIPEFTNAPDLDESGIFPDVLHRLDILSRHDDASKVLRHLGENPDLDFLNEFATRTEHPTAQPQPQPSTAATLTAEQKTQAKKARKREKKAARQLSKQSAKEIPTTMPTHTPGRGPGPGAQPAQQATTTQDASKVQERAAAKLKKRDKAARKRVAAAAGGVGVGAGPSGSVLKLVDGEGQHPQSQGDRQGAGEHEQKRKQKQKQGQGQKPGKKQQQPSSRSSASSVPRSGAGPGTGTGASSGAGSGSDPLWQSANSENFLLDRLEASLDGHG